MPYPFVKVTGNSLSHLSLTVRDRIVLQQGLGYQPYAREYRRRRHSAPDILCARRQRVAGISWSCAPSLPLLLAARLKLTLAIQPPSSATRARSMR